MSETKIALTAGINKHPCSPLRGCVNDSNIIASLLSSKFGYEIKQFLDEAATKDNFVGAMEQMARASRAGDKFVIHLSSHGTQIADKHGDEEDQLDEAFVLYGEDFMNCLLTDDDFGALLSLFNDDADVTVLIDCCHSGTGTRAPILDPIHDNPGKGMSALAAQERDTIYYDVMNRFLEPPEEFHPNKVIQRTASYKRLIDWLAKLFGTSPVYNRPRPVINTELVSVLLSACKSDQTAADARFDSGYYGAFTKSLVDVVNSTRDLTLRNVYKELCDKLNGRFTQTPQLEVWEDPILDKTIFL